MRVCHTKTKYADMAELAALNTSAASGRYSEREKVQRSKLCELLCEHIILGTANRLAYARLPR